MKKTYMPFIERPCGQPWSGMHGDDKRRFCEQCQLHVHNLSAMTPAEQRALVSAPLERTCIIYKKDGQTIVVRTRLWLWLQRLLPMVRATVAVVATIIPFAISGCATTPGKPVVPPAQTTQTAQTACPSTQTGATDDKVVYDDKTMSAGIIAMERPLWKKILWFVP